MAGEGADPTQASPNEPASPASGNEPGGLAEQPSSPQPFNREAALARLPESLRAGLSAAPTPVIQRAIEELGQGYIPKPDYTRTRQQEAQELKELRERLQREEVQRQTLERLIEQQYSRDPAAGQPAEQPSTRELASKLLEVGDPDEYWPVFENAVQSIAEKRAQALLQNHPLLRRLEAAAAADAARPEGMDPAIYRRGYESLNATFRQRGMDPDAIDPQVKAFLTPYWAELEQARAAARSGGNGTTTPEPARPAGAPAVTPPSASGTAARTTSPDMDYEKTFGPQSTLKDRVAATLAQLNMTPGDLARLRSGQRSV